MNETIRKVMIIDSKKKGVSVDLSGTLDSNPERETFSLQTINCTKKEFIDWFLEIKDGEDFCSDGETLIDIGGTSLNLAPGSVLAVTFSEWFDAWLSNTVASAKCEIEAMSGKYYFQCKENKG